MEELQQVSAAAGRGIKSLGQGALGVAGRNKALTTVGGVSRIRRSSSKLPRHDEESVDQAAIDAQTAAAAQELLLMQTLR